MRVLKLNSGWRFAANPLNVTSAIVVFILQLTISYSYVETQQSFMALPDGIENVLGFKPRSSFKCTKDGYFGDVENDCKLFHLCQQTKYPNGKTEWRHWTYACGNQTMFNQLTLTCAFIDEAVPCQHSSQFQYLNEVLHRPKEPFLTDADVTSGVSYYHNRLLSDNARARAEQQQQQSQQPLQQPQQPLQQQQPKPTQVLPTVTSAISTSSNNNNRFVTLNRPQQTFSNRQQQVVRQVRTGTANTVIINSKLQQQNSNSDRQAQAANQQPIATTTVKPIIVTTRTTSGLSNNFPQTTITTTTTPTTTTTTTNVPTTTLLSNGQPQLATNSIRTTTTGNKLIDFAIVTNHETTSNRANAPGQQQQQLATVNKRNQQTIGVTTVPTTNTNTPRRLSSSNSVRSLSTPIVGVTFSSNELSDNQASNDQKAQTRNNGINERSARQLSSSVELSSEISSPTTSPRNILQPVTTSSPGFFKQQISSSRQPIQSNQRFTNRFNAVPVRPINNQANEQQQQQLMRRINLGRELLRQQIPLAIAMSADQDIGDNRQLQDLFSSMIEANRQAATAIHSEPNNNQQHFGVLRHTNFQSARVQPFQQLQHQQQQQQTAINKPLNRQQEFSSRFASTRQLRPNSSEMLWRTSNASMPVLTTEGNDNFIRRRL